MGKSDEVRRLLDERGVEHRDNDANRAVRYTRWDNGGKREVMYEEWSNGTTRLDAGNVTPEQAITATVGGNVDLGIVDADLVAIADWQHDYASEWADGYDGYGIDGLSKDAIEKLEELVTTAQSHITEVAKHAMVEAGTCKAVLDECYYRGINGVCEGLYCSKCKEPLSRRFKHCPWCGRKIIKED